ncbi:MAG: hypothetical protein ACFE0Q_19640 [Anaerolineae bacterium]
MENQPYPKPKNRSPLRVIVNQWGCLFGLVMLALGGAVGLLGAIFIGPQLLGFDLTATALVEREIVLASTQVDLDVREQNADSQETAFALDVQATQALLNNEAQLLAQTATQSAQNSAATITAAVVENVQRQTQVANDFTSTQAALNANATRVDLDFRNTQTALGIESAQITPSASDANAPTRYTLNLSEFDVAQDDWQVSDTDDWQSGTEGLTALNAGAWLIEASPRILNTYDFDNYALTVDLRPATVIEADYWVMLALDDRAGLAVHLHTDVLRLTEVGVYRFNRDQLDQGLNRDALTVISRQAADIALDSRMSITVIVLDDELVLTIDEQTLLNVDEIEAPAGAIGVQLPAQALLLNIGVDDR